MIQLSCDQPPDPQEPWNNKCLIFLSFKLLVIYYASMKTNKRSLARLSSKLSDFPSDIFNGINLENNAQDWEMSISQVSGKWFLLTLSPSPTWLLWENSQRWTNFSTSTILQSSDYQGLNRSKRFLPYASCLFSCPHGGLLGSLVNPSPCPRACPCEPSLEEMPTPLAAGTNLWFIKHLDSLFK